MNRYKIFFSIAEKIIIVIIGVIVILFANGIKFDTEKNTLILTGVLDIKNIEKNTKINFNNTQYSDKDNLTITFLTSGEYNLEISKESRQNYKTKVSIKEGERTEISPILIPSIYKSNIFQTNTKHIIGKSKNSIFYIYELDNKKFLERVTINKTLFGIDTTRRTIDLNSFIINEKLQASISDNENLLLVSNNIQSLLVDMNNAITKDIKALLPIGDISNISIVDNNILLSIDHILYSFRVDSLDSIQRSLLFSQKFYNYVLDEEKNVNIIYQNTDKKISIDRYSLTGILQNTLSTELTPDKNYSIFYFNKNILVSDQAQIFMKENNLLKPIYENCKDLLVLDIDTGVFLCDKKILLQDKQYIKSVEINSSMIENIFVMEDSFTFFYVDKDKNLHLADFGGQDNILISNTNSNFLVDQNSSDTLLLYFSDNEMKTIKFGNEK